MPLDSKISVWETRSDLPAVLVVPAALRQLAECGDGELVEELIAVFQTDTAQRLELMRRAVDAADYSTVRLEAHTIKGSALQVGANRLADHCRQVEMEARKARPDSLVPLFRVVLRSFEEVRGVIAARG
jgi:HPt (histidine-containing phosphotransfer) domain-containing protein